jgi:hypothetical protein
VHKELHSLSHGRIELTTNFYTDSMLLDVNGVVNSLLDFTANVVAILSIGPELRQLCPAVWGCLNWKIFILSFVCIGRTNTI